MVRKISEMGFLLEGKALKAVIILLMKSWGNYEQIKDALLNYCNADAETCRKKERKESRVAENETYVQLVARMTQNLRNLLRFQMLKKITADCTDSSLGTNCCQGIPFESIPQRKDI